MNCKTRMDLPPDATVVGVAQHLGEIYLKIGIPPNSRDHTVARCFYAFCNDDYMKDTNLGFIDSIKIGERFYFIFEDDFYWRN